MTRPIGVGVIGLGVMGRTHLDAYASAAAAGVPCRVVAVCDRRPERLLGNVDAVGNLRAHDAGARFFDPASVTAHESPERLLADPSVDAVSICTRTDSHVSIALAAVRSRKHVLVEKPVALTEANVRPLADAARGSGLVVMPAMCMRFWPGWTELKRHVAARTYGAVRSAVFRRLASPPAWSTDFYRDPEQSGGALVDLHIHDADFVLHLFGPPRGVDATGSIDHVTAVYRYGADGPSHVVAEGAWDHSPGFAFRMQFTVVFERATLDFDLRRDPPLVLYRQGAVEPQPIAAGTGYAPEVRAFLSCVNDGTAPPVGVDDAVAVARLIDAERRAVEAGGRV